MKDTEELARLRQQRKELDERIAQEEKKERERIHEALDALGERLRGTARDLGLNVDQWPGGGGDYDVHVDDGEFVVRLHYPYTADATLTGQPNPRGTLVSVFHPASDQSADFQGVPPLGAVVALLEGWHLARKGKG